MSRNLHNSRQPPNDQRRSGPSTAGTSYTHTTSVNDPFYGRRRIAETCANFLVAAFDAPWFRELSYLGHFIAYALHRTKSANFVAYGALILLERLREFSLGQLGSDPGGQRQLFIAALMVASKWFDDLDDRLHDNEFWAIEVAQDMFSLEEINETERVLCSALKWDVSISTFDLDIFVAQLRADPFFRRFRRR